MIDTKNGSRIVMDSFILIVSWIVLYQSYLFALSISYKNRSENYYIVNQIFINKS